MANGTPKPIALVKGHRTKAEIAIRQKAEKDLMTGHALKEHQQVKADPVAHREFIRLKKILAAINKNDGLHEQVINRYCILFSECSKAEKMLAQKAWKADEVKKRFDLGGFDFASYLQIDGQITSEILAINRDLMAKRKMLLDIEKENIMTIQSALRSIPKKEAPKEKSAMAAFLERRQAGNNASQ